VGNAVPAGHDVLVSGFDPGAPAPLEFRRCDVAQRGMASLGIVLDSAEFSYAAMTSI